jgi:peptidoglycan/LPS O-acetylase OafA/YrhL
MYPAGNMETRAVNGHVAALDGVRGIAVLAVFLYHYGGGAQSPNWFIRSVGETMKMGWSGVPLFFVLSGFLITGILWSSIGKLHWWRTFFLRRCLRIFPLYYLTLLFVLIGSIFAHTTRELTPSFAVFFFYLQNFPFHVKIDELTPFWVGHYWSLAVEEHFYLIWPFLLAKMPSIRWARQMCLIIFLLSMATRVLIFYTADVTYYLITPARAGELAVGAWLALAVRDHPEWVPKMRRFAAPVLIASICAVAVCVAITGDFAALQMPMYVFGSSVLSFAAAALIVLALEPGTWARCFCFRPLRHLGVISYGVYIYHLLFKQFFGAIATYLAPHASRNEHLVVVFFVAACLTLVIAEISYRFFERPLLQLKDRFAPSLQPVLTISEAARV